MRFLLVIFIFFTCITTLFLPCTVSAQAVTPIAQENDPDVANFALPAVPGLLPTIASVVPGLILHGAGHYVAGDHKTAFRLLLIEGIGLVALVGGVALLATTGASEKFNAPVIGTMALGGAGFLFSWFADVYGSVGAERWTGRASIDSPLTISQGVQLVYNPILPGSVYTKTGAELAHGNWNGMIVGYWNFSNDEIRGESRFRYRLVGEGTDKPDREFFTGDRLDLSFGYDVHTYDEQRVIEHNFPISVRGRYDLKHIGPGLRGAFADAELGLVLGGYFYDSGASEFSDQVIADIGFGVYLGRGEREWGEAKVYYSHRHDGFVGGAKVLGVGSGALGNANLRVRRSVFGNWGVDVGVAAGSAYVGDLSLVYRWAE